MSFNKSISIYLLAVLLGLGYCRVGLGNGQIKNTASRDAYDLLTKIFTIHGISYGIMGQPVMFKRTGKQSDGISLYIDNVYYGKEISDLSFLQIDQIDSISVDDRSISNAGMTVEVFTKSYSSAVPVSEVRYKDAFFNYRDLSADIFQHVTPDFSFLLSGGIFDWKDNRDKYDDFKYPFEKQNFRLKLDLPEVFHTDPAIDISYRKEEKYLLALDSSHVKPEQIRSAVYFDNKIDQKMSNRLTAVHLHEISGATDNFLSIYDTFSYNDSLNALTASIGYDTQIDNTDLFYFKPEYKKTAFVDMTLTGYLAADDNSDNIMSAHIDLSKDLSLFGFETSHGYFSDDTNDQDIDLIENFFTIKKDISSGRVDYGFRAGYDMFNYAHLKNRDFYRAEFSADFINKLRFTEQYLRSASGIIRDNVLMNNIAAVTFSDKYFNDKLTVNMALNHIYSEYFIGSEIEYVNNLGFNFRARIVNFELFYGSDNFLKDKYEFNNKIYEVNKHYRYQTVSGFDMRTMDEIWGVRWTFYR